MMKKDLLKLLLSELFFEFLFLKTRSAFLDSYCRDDMFYSKGVLTAYTDT